jgi:hypothetical protein
VWRKRKENQKFASQLRIYGVICVYGHSAPLSTSPVVDSSKLAPVYDPEADRFDNPEKLAGCWQGMIKGMVQANLFTRSNFIKKTCLTNLLSRRVFGVPLHAVLSYLRGTLTDPLLHNLKSKESLTQGL